MFIKKMPRWKKEILKNHILFEIGNYVVFGMYSTNVQDPLKRKLHYVPCIIRKIVEE